MFGLKLNFKECIKYKILITVLPQGSISYLDQISLLLDLLFTLFISNLVLLLRLIVSQSQILVGQKPTEFMKKLTIIWLNQICFGNVLDLITNLLHHIVGFIIIILLFTIVNLFAYNVQMKILAPNGIVHMIKMLLNSLNLNASSINITVRMNYNV